MEHSEIVERLNIFCEYCTPTRVDADIVRQSLDSAFSDFEDALQYYSALTEDAEVIITRNGNNVKLIDFGLSSTEPSEATAQCLDPTSTPIGDETSSGTTLSGSSTEIPTYH